MVNTDKLLYRILLGYYYITVENKQYKIVYPSMQTKYRAEMLYDEIIEDNKYDKNWLTKEEIDIYLYNTDIWNKNLENSLKGNEKLLEQAKVDLYLGYSNEKKRTRQKRSITNINKEIDSLTTRKNSMSHLTIEDHASSIKNQFLIMDCIYEDNKLLFNNNNSDNYDSQMVQKFLIEIIQSMIQPASLKSIARSDLCRSYFSCCDTKKGFVEVNDDYRHLISLYNMYDNIRQHPECPSDDIIKDDDALDGWFIYQQEKTRREKKKNEIMSKVGGKLNNAGEVFLISDDEEERREIFDINDDIGKKQILELAKVGNEKKNVLWQDLDFVKESFKQR